MIKKLLLSTGNPGKLKEMKQGLNSLLRRDWQLFSLSDFNITQEADETGSTFKENAKLKACFYAGLAKIPAVADDGGFVIPALNGAPGVKSARWLGEQSTDETLIQHTLQMIKPFSGKNRRAYLELILCFYDPVLNQYLYENEKIHGYIAEKPVSHRIKGFPYRALLKVEPFGKYYDELTPQEHHQVNHRLRALQKLQSKLISKYE